MNEVERAWNSYLRACRESKSDEAVYRFIESIEWRRLRRRLLSLQDRENAAKMREHLALSKE